MNPKVAVVGAGIAGLTCARRLIENNVDVQVFDKGRHLGGRVATRFASRSDSSFYFDHGAQYFTARSEVFKSETDSWIESGVAAPWEGKIGSVLKGEFESQQGSHARYVGIPYMRSIAEYLGRNLSVDTGCRVQQIHQDGTNYLLEFELGESSSSYEAVVLAVPPAQAAALLDDFSDLKTQSSMVKMSACWSTFVSFKTDLQIEFDGLFVNGSALSWICRDSSKPLRPRGERWVLHSTHDWAERHLDLQGDEVSAILLQELFAATNHCQSPVEFQKSHRWLYAFPKEELQNDYLQSGRLLVCGDWCGGSRVESAYLSG